MTPALADPLIIKRCAAALIDFDGTMADTLDCAREAFRDFLQRQGCREKEGEFESFNGTVLKDIIASLKKSRDLNADHAVLETQYRAILDEKYGQAQPSPGVADALRRLKNEGCAVAVVSAAPESLITEFLRRHYLQDLVDAVITPSAGERGKPAPDLYEKALKTLCIEPGAALALEDSTNGMAAARAAGVAVMKFPEDCALDFQSFANAALPAFERVQLDATFQVRENPLAPHAPSLLFTMDHYDGRSATGRFDPYEKALASGRPYLAVTGLVQDSGGMLWGLRHPSMRSYGAFWELPPSGGVSGPAQGGLVDVQGELLRELEEELGITAAHICSVEPVALLREKGTSCVDAVCVIHSNIPLAPRAAAFKANGEYTELCYVPFANLVEFLRKHSAHVVPTSLALLKLLNLR